MNLRTLPTLDLDQKKVLVRLDLNVPIENGKITDETRIKAVLPTLNYILERTPKVAIMSHLGRPKGAADPKFSLEPVAARLGELLGREVAFINDYSDRNTNLGNILGQIDNDQVMVLENLRFHPGETANDAEFARHLVTGFDCFVNDAFGTCHRAHASVVGAAEVLGADNCAAGLLIQKEIEALGPLLEAPKAPFTVVMGGSKVSDKIGIMLRLIEKCNTMLIGGAMAYTFLKYQNIPVGRSRVEADKLDLVAAIYDAADRRNVKIEIPFDHFTATDFDPETDAIEIDSEAIPDHLMGLDIGEKTAARYQEVLKNSATALWNGPMGVFEWPQFAKGSMAVAEGFAACEGRTIIGGGDSVACANMAGIGDKVDHISTGGGASLEYLEGKVLPGLKVLARS